MGALLALFRVQEEEIPANLAGNPQVHHVAAGGRARVTARGWRRQGRLLRAPNGQWESGRRVGRLARNTAYQSWSALGHEPIS